MTNGQWSDATNGGRTHLKEALEAFRLSHQNSIDMNLPVSSKAYQVATMAVITSCGWIEELISFMEELQTELT